MGGWILVTSDWGLKISLSKDWGIEIKIDAKLLDQQTKQPIAYANIGFVEKGIGTVSNEKGEFSLVYDEDKVGENEILQISVLGYETLTATKKQFERFLTNTSRIFLKPKQIFPPRSWQRELMDEKSWIK